MRTSLEDDYSKVLKAYASWVTAARSQLPAECNDLITLHKL